MKVQQSWVTFMLDAVQFAIGLALPIVESAAEREGARKAG